MSYQVQHEDFGEKIGGARKDLWSSRGLYISDLTAMNNREADKHVKKDNIWKKPDYQALIHSGIPVDVAFFIKTVRDSLPASPVCYSIDPDKVRVCQENYIRTIRAVQEATEKVRTKQDAMGLFNSFLIDIGYVERTDSGLGPPRYRVTELGAKDDTLTTKFFSAIQVTTETKWQSLSKKARQMQFGVAKNDKLPPRYAIHLYDGKNVRTKGVEEWVPNTYYVTHRGIIQGHGFATREDALKFAQGHCSSQKKNGKARYIPAQLARVRRTGPDYRQGREIVGEDYLNAFAFKGGEFGNWMNQADRQESLNMGYEALLDLADTLQITDRDISYQGILSIAFGARGHGDAVAHYEPLRKVINLTKMRGAGSLAHEWWHGLDDYLGHRLGTGNLLSTSPRKYKPMERLVKVIKYRAESVEEARQRFDVLKNQVRQRAGRAMDNTVLPSLKRAGNEAALTEYEQLKAEYLDGLEDALEKVNALAKRVTGHVIPKEDRDDLSIRLHSLRTYSDRVKEPAIGQRETDYYSQSKLMSTIYKKDGGYWESSEELTARAFATYILDKLPTRSDYLVGHAECCVGTMVNPDGKIVVVRAYPQGEERTAINGAFDELFEALREDGILTHHIREWEPEQPEAPLDIADGAVWVPGICAPAFEQVSLI